jgi:hypothetical protein
LRRICRNYSINLRNVRSVATYIGGSAVGGRIGGNAGLHFRSVSPSISGTSFIFKALFLSEGSLTSKALGVAGCLAKTIFL